MTIRECLITALLLPALGITTGQANAQGSKDLSATLDSGEMTERWLFLGRRSEGGWHPPSVSISAPPYPVSPGNKVVVRRHALVYGSVDCKVLDAADFKADDEAAPSVELVKAGEQGLEITGPAIECPSVCGAKTVWVNVRIPAARLVRIDH
jgi:hypothetical protein